MADDKKPKPTPTPTPGRRNDSAEQGYTKKNENTVSFDRPVPTQKPKDK